MPTPANHSQQSASNQNELAGLNDRSTNHRAKRQSAGREQLCQTTYQYITPQAALNSQGRILGILKISKKNFVTFFSRILISRQLDVCRESSRYNKTIGANGNVRVS